MKLQTPVEIRPLPDRFTYADRFFFMGSCFASEVGALMGGLEFDTTVNPFGVLYNPASLVSSFDRLDSRRHFVEEDVICSEGRYTSFFHHSSFSRCSAEEFLSNANQALEESADAFAAADAVVVTLGTSWVFRHLERDMIVSNCHKVHPAQFRRERLSVAESVALLEPVIARHQGKRWIFTVSPIRHLKDGAHGNQVSKASLLLAVEELAAKFECVSYFPAYEIVLDELRDYRFYKEDMVHPSEQAVGYVFEKFVEFAIESGEAGRMEDARRRMKAAAHRKIQFAN